MLARVRTFSIDGLDTRPVTAEVDVRQGLPGFVVVGLGDAAVREARERVRAALSNSGFEFPLRRIVANLAPAHLRKGGSGFDLAIACGILAASGQVPGEAFERLTVFGELSLGGELRGCAGTLAVAEAVLRTGGRALLLARERAGEAALVDDVELLALGHLRELPGLLKGTEPLPVRPIPAESAPPPGPEPDLADVRGQAHAVDALRIAAAGGHNLLLVGSPGTGKTMLARRLPSVLPELEQAEALEVTRIHSLVGRHTGGGLIRTRPFRAPHHTISASGLVGGGAVPAPGEATLAHRGVLFLDELSEFARPALEALRQPLEDGHVVIVRGQRTVLLPTRFMLVAATNPCPCGYAGEPERCRCGEADHARHARRLSGPLLDRIDLRVHVHRPGAQALEAPPFTDSRTVRADVAAARERQALRLVGTGVRTNAAMDAGLVRRFAWPDAEGRAALRRAYGEGDLSARAHERVLKVARTLADLDGSDVVRAPHVLHALGLREQAHTERRAA